MSSSTIIRSRSTPNNSHGNRLPKDPLGQVPFPLNYASHMVNMNKESPKSVFPVKAVPNLFNLLRGEIVYNVRDCKDASDKDSGYGLTALNGIGRKEKELFPDDPEAQRDALEDRIDVLGTSLADLPETGMAGDKFSVSRGGMRTGYGTFSMPFGKYVKASVPHPRHVEDMGENMFTPGIPKGKVTMIYEPYVPEASAERGVRIIKSLIHDPVKFGKAFEKNYIENLRKHAAIDTINKTRLMDALIVMSKLMELGVIDPINFTNDWNIVTVGAPGIAPSEQIMGLAVALGVLGRSYQVPNITIGGKIQRYNKLKHTLLSSLTWDGKIANYGFGVAADGRNAGLVNGKPDLNSARGKMLHQQLNGTKQLLMAVEDLNFDQWEKITGRVLYSGTQGTNFVQN
jgi:hypothetical protein